MTPSPQYLLNKAAQHMEQANKYIKEFRALIESNDQDQPLAKIRNGEFATTIEAQPQRRVK